MPNEGLTRLISIGLIVVVFGALAWQRFDTPPQMPVSVVATEQINDMSNAFRRGQVVTTNANERLLLRVGDASLIAMDERTELTLTNLTEAEPTFLITKGRVWLSTDDHPISVTTHRTQVHLPDGQMTMVHFDFLRQVKVVPLEGASATIRTEDGTTRITDTAVTVYEADESAIEPAELDRENGPAAEFYEWVDAHRRT